MKKYFLLPFLLFSFLTVFSQKGKNGAGNIVGSTVVNAYTALSADAFTGNTTISVASAAGYGVGDLIYIIQMQGASVNCFINPFGNPNSAEPLSPAFGKITNYNNSGNNEYAQISSVAGNVITIDCPLKYNYTAAGKVQVVKVPRYTTLTIAATGTITCPAWNGTTGGVIAIEVDGNTTINAGGSIDASGLGFRGGTLSTGALFGAGAWSHNNPQEGARKGESIAGDVTVYLANFQGQYCRGAVANGGGGANSNNAGGGGGANAGDTSLYTGFGNPDISVAGYVTAWNLESAGFAATSSSGGGKGGYTFSNATLSPLTNGPGVAGWNGDTRRAVGGMGGRPLNYNTGRLFCGGGGGAGDQNDNYGGAGGDGGGIINIISYGTISGAGQIVSNGENGFNTNTTGAAPANNCNGRDGAGGAGGGGAISIKSLGLISAISVSARGGNGGNQQMKSGFFTATAMAYGPGGGGGGGYIGTTASAITAFVNGGINGIVQYLSGNENCQIDNLFPPNGSTIGGSGTVASTLLVVPTITASPDVTICVNNAATVTATITGAPGPVNWYSATAGPTLLGTGSPFTTSVFPTPGTYTVFAGFCPDGTYRDPVVITVVNGPTLTATSATICASQTGTISAAGATTYTWSTTQNNPTITASPASTTVYTVTGSIGTCTASTTATITVNSSASISVNSATICNGQNAILTAGAATSYTWSTSANTPSISVNPATNTTYTINATTAGGCVVTNTALVTVNASPTLTPVSTTVCAGQPGTISASGATNYTWAVTGANTFSTSASPLTTTSYSVIGANGTCTSSANATITVNPNPTITVLSATVCAGQPGTIVASGASTYTWNLGPTTNTFSATPAATTIYTVNGTSGTCTSSATGTITVNTAAPIAVTPATICSGQSATLTAGAATSYTWSTGANTSTISVNPNSTTTYTINATMPGGCVATNIATVTVNATPTLVLASTTICVGQTGTLSASGATNYTWAPTASNNSSITASPATTTSYTVVGATGTCTSSASASIVVGAVGSIVVNSPTICAGQTATLTAGPALSYTWLVVGGNASTVSVNPAVTTVYTVNAITAGGCNVVGTSTVTVNSNPTVTATSTAICIGQTGTISASGATTYTWSTGATTPTLTDNPSVNTTYTVTGANGSCTSSATASITVNGGSISVNSPTMCYNQPAIINAGPALSYTWSNGANTSSIVVAPPTNSVYIVNATLPGGCVVTSTSNVTVIPIPTVSANNASICVGQSATITAIGAPTFTWTFGGTTAQVVLTPTQSTGYTFTGISPNGCYATGSMTIFIIPPPVINATSATVCAGQSATLTASGATSYTWDPSGFNIVSATFTDAPAATAIYTVIGAVNGCTASTTASIVIGSNLNISVNSPTICSGQTATLIAISTATNYLWSTLATTPSIFVNPVSNTSYTITGSKGACTGSAVANVVVNPTPNVSITAGPVCAGGTVALIGSGASSFSWSTGANNMTSIVVSPTANTTYTAVGSTGFCTVSAVYNLTLSPVPVITAANQSICNGGTTTLTANGATTYTWLPSGIQNSSITVNPNVNTTYTVIGANGSCKAQTTVSVTVVNGLLAPVNNATICQGQVANIGTTLSGTSYSWSNGGTTQTIIVSPATTTNYSLLVVAGSCSYTATATVAVIPTPTILLNSPSICLGATATLSASGATNGYTWNPGNISGNVITVSPTVNTTYVVTSANGQCPATATTQVTVNTKPILTFSPAELMVCPGTAVTFSANGANIYEWYVNGVYHFGVPLTVTPSKTSTVTIVGSNGGCSTTSTTLLYVNDVTASFIAESNYVDYPGTLTFTNTSVGATSISWDFGNGQTSANNVSTAFYEYPGKYLTALVATNNMGCMDTTYYLIEAGCGKGDFYIPNTFTPNNDGLNEEFKVLGGSCVTQFTGSVFDRWGNEIFKWKDISTTWDGNFKGKAVQEGVYNYLITYTLYNGKVFNKAGHVSIIR